MKNAFVPAACAAVLIALLSGCASSNSSTSGASAQTAASTSASTAAAAASTHYGAAASSSPSSGGPSAPVSITVKHSKLGVVLAAGPKKLTAYLFEADRAGASSCTGDCAKVWPPVTTTGTPSVSGAANAADIGTVARTDGTTQVTYKGHPLYFYIKDQDNGDAYGQGLKSFGAPWYVLAPSGSKIDPS